MRSTIRSTEYDLLNTLIPPLRGREAQVSQDLIMLCVGLDQLALLVCSLGQSPTS